MTTEELQALQALQDTYLEMRLAEVEVSADRNTEYGRKTPARRIYDKDSKDYEKKDEAFVHPNQEKIDANGNGEVDAHDFKLLRKKAAKKAELEEVESLEELSKKTLGSYVNKATGDVGWASTFAANAERGSKEKEFYLNIKNKRKNGSEVAVAKLTKEEVELDEDNFEKNMAIVKSGKLPPHIQAILDKRGAKGNEAIMAKGREAALKSMSPMHIKQAIGIANDKRYKGGNMTGAVSAMEKLHPGLSNHPKVKDALRLANESVELAEGGWPLPGQPMKTTATITKNKDGSTTTSFPDGTWKIESKNYIAKKKPTNLIYTHAKSDVAYQNLVHQLHKEEVELEAGALDEEELDEITSTFAAGIARARSNKRHAAHDVGRGAEADIKNTRTQMLVRQTIERNKKKQLGDAEYGQQGQGSATAHPNMNPVAKRKLTPPKLNDEVSVFDQARKTVADDEKKGVDPKAKFNLMLAKAKNAQRVNKALNDSVEEVELDEAKKEPMEVYHSGYSAALQHAEKHLNKQGYEIHPDDWQHHISHGPAKPSGGKTVKLHIPLHKDGVPTKKVAHIQVYNRGNEIPKNNELNMYVN